MKGWEKKYNLKNKWGKVFLFFYGRFNKKIIHDIWEYLGIEKVKINLNIYQFVLYTTFRITQYN
jgi:hypothetical protein